MAGEADDTDAIDIKALLSVALDQRPRDDLSERVVGRVAAMTTVAEFARLVVAAPFSWLSVELTAESDPGDTQKDDPDDGDVDDTPR